MIGTAHPILFEDASTEMTWAVLCQARRDTDNNGRVSMHLSAEGELLGDRPQRYFVEGEGPGTPIDDFVAGDASGRYAAWVAQGRLMLRDVVTKSQVDLTALGADTQQDESSYTPHRAVTFDPTGPRLAYLRQHGDRQWIVVRHLETGDETVHSPGSGSIWRLSYEPEGQFLSVYAVVADTNGNRRREWPFPLRDSNSAPCGGPVPHYNVWEFPGDTPKHRLLRLSDGQLIEPSGFVMSFGSAYVERNDDNELWLNPAATRRQLITSSVCNGRVLHADASRDAIVVGCANAYGERREILLWTSLFRRKLNIDVAAYEVDGRLAAATQLLPLYPRNEAYLLDFQSLQLIALQPNDEVLATLNDSVLLQRGRTLGFLRLKPGASGRLGLDYYPGRVIRPPLAQIRQVEGYASVGPALFNLVDRRHVGSFAEAPLALSQSGHGLIFTARPRSSSGLRKGPLRWVRPKRSKP